MRLWRRSTRGCQEDGRDDGKPRCWDEGLPNGALYERKILIHVSILVYLPETEGSEIYIRVNAWVTSLYTIMLTRTPRCAAA